jgi:hypothetical protein
MTTIIEDEFEADFANFAAVVFAAAEDHDLAYCESTLTTPSQYKSSASCLPTVNQFWGTSASAPVKAVPKLNMAGSEIFARRAKAAAAKANAAVAVANVQ